MQAAWEELGIAPTADAVAIKRAYAKRLKHTRPDDDAAAYQRLREAYDAALHWARRQEAAPAADTIARHDGRTAPAAPVETPPPSSGEDEDEAPVPADGDGLADPTALPALADVPPEDDEDEDAAPVPASDDGLGDPEATARPIEAAPPDAAGTPEDFASPGDIARGVHAFWREHGDAALIRLWPRVRQDLDALPFALRGEASNWMATLVLDCPELPAGFVAALDGHFHWSRDFRSAATLGAARAHALHERLRAQGATLVPDAATKRRYEDVFKLDALLQQERRWRARLLAMLLPGGVAERWAQTPEDLRRRLGIGPYSGFDIDRLFRWNLAGRIVGLAALFFGICLLSPENDYVMAIAQSVIVLGVGVLTAMGATIAMGVYDRIADALPASGRHARMRHPGRWTAAVLTSAAGVVVFAFTIPDESQGNPIVLFLGGLGFALALPAFDWPRQRPWRFLLLPAAIMLAIVLGYARTWPTPLAPFGLALFWTLAASALLSHRTGAIVEFYRNPFTRYRPASPWGWILTVMFIKGLAVLAAAVAVLALPLTLFVASLRHGMFSGIATLACALAIASASGEGWNDPAALLLSLLCATWLMAALRWGAGKLAGRVGRGLH